MVSRGVRQVSERDDRRQWRENCGCLTWRAPIEPTRPMGPVSSVTGKTPRDEEM